MKLFNLLLILLFLLPLGLSAQFASVTKLDDLTIDAGVGTHHKAQSKVFNHDGKHWAALSNSTGTHLWRLDGTSWTPVLMLTSRKGRADCKIVGNVVHVFVYQSNTSQLISAEYVPASKSFKIWTSRPSAINFSFNSEVRTATIDVDGTGRMWLAYARNTEVHVLWSDAPYSNWSSPITIATGLRSDDAAAVVAMPGKIGVFWSNQNTKRWGFKTHTDGAAASIWSTDEVPSSQSALNVGYGMADDHMNLKVAGDGTLYCAIKTGYNDGAYPLIGLLVRRPSGTWDDLYDVSHIGTTPIVVLNETVGKLRVIYPSKTYGGDILYNESPLSNISIGPQMTLMKGTAFRDPTSSKQNFSPYGVVLTTDVNAGIAAGVVVNGGSASSDPLEQFTLTVNLEGSGTVTKSPDQDTYVSGSTMQLTATAAPGYQFTGWRGDITDTTNPLSLTINENTAVTANFTVIPDQKQVNEFFLVDAHTEQDVQAIKNGATIILSSLPNTKLNIRANTSSASVGSVKFELSGAQSKVYSDNTPPYALHGDNGSGNYYYGNWNPPATGTYTLKATPYTGSKASGTAGAPLTITFTIVESDELVTGSSTEQHQIIAQRLANHPNGIPTGLARLSAYPNPFSDNTSVSFISLEEGDYTLSLYDSRGILLRVLQQGKAIAGESHKLSLDGSYLKNGLYIIRLQTRSKSESTRLMLER